MFELKQRGQALFYIYDGQFHSATTMQQWKRAECLNSAKQLARSFFSPQKILLERGLVLFSKSPGPCFHTHISAIGHTSACHCPRSLFNLPQSAELFEDATPLHPSCATTMNLSVPLHALQARNYSTGTGLLGNEKRCTPDCWRSGES